MAFEELPWLTSQADVMRAQRSATVAVEQIPGSYYTSRCLDNAFRSVIYDGENPRKVFEKQVKIIDSELERKRLELE